MQTANAKGESVPFAELPWWYMVEVLMLDTKWVLEHIPIAYVNQTRLVLDNYWDAVWESVENPSVVWVYPPDHPEQKHHDAQLRDEERINGRPGEQVRKVPKLLSAAHRQRNRYHSYAPPRPAAIMRPAQVPLDRVAQPATRMKAASSAASPMDDDMPRQRDSANAAHRQLRASQPTEEATLRVVNTYPIEPPSAKTDTVSETKNGNEVAESSLGGATPRLLRSQGLPPPPLSLPPEEEEIPKPSRKSKSASTAKTASEPTSGLKDIQVTFGKSDVAHVKHQQEEFYRSLCQLAKYPKRAACLLTPKQAADLTNFIFHDLFGPSANQRVFSLVTFYDREQPYAHAQAMRQVLPYSNDTSLPPLLREYASCKAEWISSITKSTEQYREFKSRIYYNNMVKVEIKIMEMLSTDRDLQKTVLGYSKDCKGNRRKAWLVDYIADQRIVGETPDGYAAMDRGTRRSLFGHVPRLVKIFSTGIIALLPTKLPPARLNRMHEKDQDAVYDLIRQHTQKPLGFVDDCRWVEEKIAKPIANDEAIPFLVQRPQDVMELRELDAGPRPIDENVQVQESSNGNVGDFDSDEEIDWEKLDGTDVENGDESDHNIEADNLGENTMVAHACRYNVSSMPLEDASTDREETDSEEVREDVVERGATPQGRVQELSGDESSSPSRGSTKRRLSQAHAQLYPSAPEPPGHDPSTPIFSSAGNVAISQRNESSTVRCTVTPSSDEAPPLLPAKRRRTVSRDVQRTTTPGSGRRQQDQPISVGADSSSAANTSNHSPKAAEALSPLPTMPKMQRHISVDPLVGTNLNPPYTQAHRRVEERCSKTIPTKGTLTFDTVPTITGLSNEAIHEAGETEESLFLTQDST